jgi:protein ImuB
MFACLYLPPPANPLHVRAEGNGSLHASADGKGQRAELVHPAHAAVAQRSDVASVAQRFSAVVELARDFSPRVETYGERTVTLDVSGLGSLIGEPRAIGEELRRAAADSGLRVHVAIAATTTAAILLAHARAGLTVVPARDEATAVAPLPLDLLDLFASNAPNAPNAPIAPNLKRWGLKTLGDLASLPPGELSARLGQHGLRWQKWARGEEVRPLVPAGVAEVFEESLDLEWPIEGLEPLSFVLARLLDPLCDRLDRRDRGAVVLRLTLTLVNRALHERVVELPAPMRDARVLRTLALLDLESHPPPEAIDRVTVGVDVTEGRVLQFGLFARALPSDKLATLMARLGALMGSDRVGAPALVDSYRPGAFAMAAFNPGSANDAGRADQAPARLRRFAEASAQPEASGGGGSHHRQGTSVLRRFRRPVAARVALEHGRPVRITTDRRGLSGGLVERCEGPWRSSGDWWCSSSIVDRRPWNCDEWDVALRDGATYRISHALDSGAWFVEGMVD